MRSGREAKSEFGESLAVDVADECLRPTPAFDGSVERAHRAGHQLLAEAGQILAYSAPTVTAVERSGRNVAGNRPLRCRLTPATPAVV